MAKGKPFGRQFVPDHSLAPILLKKSVLGDERNFLGSLMRFARDDVRDHIVSPKTAADLCTGTEERCSGREGIVSTFARFSVPFNFRLFQQYPPSRDIRRITGTHFAENAV
jgi:hypothetical protein